MVHPITLAVSFGIGLGAMIYYALFLSNRTFERPLRQPPHEYTYEPEDSDLCSICRDALGSGNTERLNCGHTFHIDCIDQSRRLCGSQCPNCRRRI